jgi:CHAT domain-containing protein
MSGVLSSFDEHASTELHGWLLARPIESLPKGTRITVIPDAELGAVPFEVLARAHPGGQLEFAAQSYAFAYSPSATVLRHQRKGIERQASGRARSRLLAMGDPVYDVSDPRTGHAGRPTRSGRQDALRSYSQERTLGLFKRLPWTAEEVRAVAAAVGQSKVLADVRLGHEASEATFKTTDVSSYRYLHFATHGVLAGDLPYLQQPALVLSQVGDLKGEDGFLTMNEVLNLPLDADLTTLSACQTGLGERLSGEGVMGRRRGNRSAHGSFLWSPFKRDPDRASTGACKARSSEQRGMESSVFLG